MRVRLSGLLSSAERRGGLSRGGGGGVRQWVLGGNTRAEGKIVGVFEPETEIIRQGKASKRNEFGKLVKIQEAENQIVTHYEVYDQRPSDSELLTPSI